MCVSKLKCVVSVNILIKSDPVQDNHWMSKALEQARIAEAMGEVPVGAVLVGEGVALASGYNQPRRRFDPTAHAEIIVLRMAAERLRNYRLPNTTIYVTLEPCNMCLGALIHARVSRLVFGAREPRSGAIISRQSSDHIDYFNHKIEWSEGVLAEESASLLTKFFESRRKKRSSCLR